MFALFQGKAEQVLLSGPALSEILRAVLGKGVPVRFQAKGFSMSPFIKNGDVVTISPLEDTSPGVGDVIAFVHEGTDRLYVHRVIRKKGEFYIPKGDSILGADGSVSRKDVLGFVTRVERNGKDVFLGLGPERFVIAFLGCRGLLLPFIHSLRKVVRSILKRSAD
jgi:signal peptidase I